MFYQPKVLPLHTPWRRTEDGITPPLICSLNNVWIWVDWSASCLGHFTLGKEPPVLNEEVARWSLNWTGCCGDDKSVTSPSPCLSSASPSHCTDWQNECAGLKKINWTVGSTVCLEKLSVSQPVKKIPIFYGIQKVHCHYDCCLLGCNAVSLGAEFVIFLRFLVP